MEELLKRREELLSQIRRIAETCEGIDNEANAKRVEELNGRQSALLAKKSELKSNLAAVDSELATVGKTISDLSAAGLDRILDAIKNQRWYFFANKPKVLMDRDTALLWADLNYFPYGKNNNHNSYSNSSSYAEVKDLIAKTNSESWGGFSDWKIPTPFELWKMIEDKSFPFHTGDTWRIKGWCYWCVNYNGCLFGKDLDDSGATTDISSYDVVVLPCSHAYVPTDYENNISPSNNFYTEKEKLQFTLNIFVQNELIPMFNDAEITQLYRKIFVDKPELLKELAEVEAQIAESEQSQIRLTANFNYRAIIAKYDVAAIKYFDAVLSVTDELLNVLQEYEASQSETIAEFLKITLNLGAKYTDNPNLTAEENSLLSERQKILARRLEIGIDVPKQKLLFVKMQAENFFAHLDKINGDNSSIRQLAELQAEPRADFELLVENMARIIREVQQRVDFFAMHKEFVSNVVKAHIGWSNDYKAFKTSLRTELASICRKENIDDEVFASWYEDWRKKRLAIEQRFLPLVEFGLKGALSEAVSKVLWFLGEYRGVVDKFYLHERKNIYQKFAFVPGGDLQEKFETESELYKLAEKFQRDLQGIIFACDKTEERIFLLRWSEPILNLPIDEISNFIRDKELDAIAEEVLTQLAKLKRQNFAEYLADSKAYSDAAQKRQKEFNALIFRMRKDLSTKERAK